MKKPSHNTRSRKMAAYGSIILLVFVFGVIIWKIGKPSHQTTINPQATVAPTPSINPKTDTEQAQHQPVTPTPAPTSTAQVDTNPQIKPTIVGVDGHDNPTVGAITVDALPGAATSGTCQAVLTKGGSRFTVVSQITMITSYYACATLRFDKAPLPPGDWSLVVSIDNPSGTGTSDSRVITVKK